MSEFAEHPDVFEAKIPFDCVLDLVKLIRSGEFRENVPKILQEAGWILGCTGRWLDGRQAPFGVAKADLPQDLSVCAEAVEREIKAQQESEENATFGLNPLVVLLIEQLVKLLLERLQEN